MSLDAAVRRREARVGKILGNLEKRLNKISGTNSIEDLKDDDFLLSARAEAEEPSSSLFPQSNLAKVEELIQKFEKDEPKSLFVKFITENFVHVALLAIFTSVLLRTHAAKFICESVMVPFYTFEIGKLAFGQDPTNTDGSLIYSFLSFFASTNRKASIFLYFFSMVAAIWRDFCLYLFLVLLATAIFGY